jgi:hypothetical protein
MAPSVTSWNAPYMMQKSKHASRQQVGQELPVVSLIAA